MRHIRAAFARLRGVFTRDAVDAELREELESHVEMETAANVRRGMSPEEARRQALLAAGGVTQAAEAVRDRRGIPWIETLGADIRYAARSLRHKPAFTVVVVVTLALAIGANTAIFSVVHAVLLKPLPHLEGDRLLYLHHSSDAGGGDNLSFSVPEVRDLREGVPSLGGIAEYSPWSLIHHSEEVATRISVGLVTGNYFEVMGLSTVIGRVTEPSDDGAGVPPVMVLTHEFWMTRFGGDHGIVGEQIDLDGESVTIIGVLQPAPFFPDRVDGLLNMVISDHHVSATMVEGRSHRMTEVVARLDTGATVAQARAEVEAVFSRMQSAHPEAYQPDSRHRIAVVPFQEAIGEGARLTLLLLMAAAAFVLIIAAANVANLTLMRGVRREQELVVRAALGAGAGRLRRLLLAENLVLTVLGAVFGIVIAIGGVRLLTAFAARYSPRAEEIRLDGTVLGFTMALAIGLALILSFIGSLPREGTLAAKIAAGARRMRGSVKKQRLQRALVVVQVAVSVILLTGAGLLTRTMLRIAEVDTGLGTEQVLTMQVPLLTPMEIMSMPDADGAAKGKYELIREEISALPGVLEVGVGFPMPLGRSGLLFDVKRQGRAGEEDQADPRAELRSAGPEYFRAAGIPLLQGREFTLSDQPGSGEVVIVNQTFADRFFPGEDPVGKAMAWTGEVLQFTPFSGEWRTIVGVVGDTRDGGLDAETPPAVFMPFAQVPAIGGGFVIRAERDAAALVPGATAIVQQNAPRAPIEHVMTVSQYKDRSVSPRRLNAALVSSFGILALIIAAVGIGGVLAFSVSSRTNEIGVRMSLGADCGHVQRMILREGGVLIASGLALGMGGALVSTRLIRGLLFGVAPHDVVTFAGVALVMMTIGIFACWLPARRAARIDPASAMRAD